MKILAQSGGWLAPSRTRTARRAAPGYGGVTTIRPTATTSCLQAARIASQPVCDSVCIGLEWTLSERFDS